MLSKKQTNDSGMVLTKDMVRKARQVVNNYTEFRSDCENGSVVDINDLLEHAGDMCRVLDDIARNQHLFNTEVAAFPPDARPEALGANTVKIEAELQKLAEWVTSLLSSIDDSPERVQAFRVMYWLSEIVSAGRIHNADDLEDLEDQLDVSGLFPEDDNE